MYNTEKSGATFMSHRFLYIYKYRLNGNVGIILQGQGEPCMSQLMCLFLHGSDMQETYHPNT